MLSFLRKILTNTGPKPYFFNNFNIKNNYKYKKNYIYSSKFQKNRKKTFYVIRRSPGAGMFSNFIYVLNHLEICEKLKFIPVVDMENFTTIYNEKNKINNTYNAWEYYFKQVSNYSLKNVYKSKNIILTKNKFYKNFSHNISNRKYRNIADKFIKIDNLFLKKSESFFKKYLCKNTLAIHYRGTSYKTSAGHPFPATFKQSINYIKNLISKKKYKKIFLCTEDSKFFNEMKDNFKNNLFYFNSFRSKKDDAFLVYPRNNHRYKLGEEILVESLIIAKCKGFLHATTNVSEFVKFLDKKKKINYYKLDNGINTTNEYLAPYLWYYKNIAPPLIGGFKKKL